MKGDKRAFYEYHASLMEPWDGPAAIAFTDGRVIERTLDRNGLRPGRYVVTRDGLVVLASEAGVLDIPPQQIKTKGRLQPGKMFLVDTVEGRIVSDKRNRNVSSRGNLTSVAQAKPDNAREVTRAHPRPRIGSRDYLCVDSVPSGYSAEDLSMILEPMARTGEEPVGSMGNDTPLACLSDQPQSLFNYFKQLFAQVTNPPIDPIREEMVMSLTSYIGAEGNILDETPANCSTLKLAHPILTNRDLEKLRRVSRVLICSQAHCRHCFGVNDGASGLKWAVDELCRRASLAVRSGYTLLILSDRRRR